MKVIQRKIFYAGSGTEVFRKAELQVCIREEIIQSELFNLTDMSRTYTVDVQLEYV